jgi:hypothetical protein
VIALKTTDPFSRQRGRLRKKNKVIVRLRKKSKIKSGQGSQREARNPYELVDCLSAATRTPTADPHRPYPKDTEGSFPGVKPPGHEAVPPPPNIFLRLRMFETAYTCPPQNVTKPTLRFSFFPDQSLFKNLLSLLQNQPIYASSIQSLSKKIAFCLVF